MQDGDLAILGSANVTGNGVTFLISGSSSNINIQTSGTITLSPVTDSSAGGWAGFLFLLRSAVVDEQQEKHQGRKEHHR